jgi:hypothetical protein
MTTLQSTFISVNGKALFAQCMRWQQHALLIHAFNVHNDCKTIALSDNLAE